MDSSKITRIGIDLAKQVFQLHGVDVNEQVVWRRQLKIGRRVQAVRQALMLLPDHWHAIWTLPSDDADFATCWRLIKSHVTRQCAFLFTPGISNLAPLGKTLWHLVATSLLGTPAAR